ncbi:isochorismatase family protein [Corynebacterium lizhenjunii]|uniref:nicotinamidase n=1 Tax=Corynebacterium lizhenjunii TaxID=2709394 RepID=A0A7T0KEZ1_9CORY|nr:isochorismatase family protein [Corynebacterium lizhenjunii]QPK78819.1 isochorismatase family protein [Corynebacterium lizhenjunii]
MKTALLIVDVQPDFCPGGALATARGNEVAEKIAAIQPEYDTVVTTQDWHIDPAGHFSTEPDFVDTWPVHCVAGTPGAALHPALLPADAAFRKGAYTAAYSGFEGTLAGPGDTTGPDTGEITGEDTSKGQGLEEWLREEGIGRLDICGIATDHCVRATAADALRAGFSVRILAGLCSPVDEQRANAALEELSQDGATIVY